jgi:outer membrane receptor protein involved in Fe transport
VNNAVIQGEYFHRRESGALINDPDGAAIASDYHGRDSGYYLQGVYQFVPHWRIGVRYDWIESDNTVSNPAPDTDLATLADNSRHPQRESAMVDWSHSEFSRIRLQYNRDRSRPGGATDNQIFLQYIFAMGSHPAHTF